jgi:hypothetical protein
MRLIFFIYFMTRCQLQMLHFALFLVRQKGLALIRCFWSYYFIEEMGQYVEQFDLDSRLFVTEGELSGTTENS